MRALLPLFFLPACSMAGQWDTFRGPGDSVDDTGGDSAGDDSAVGPALVITELMKDPDAVSDDFGEWFEITNTGSAAVDLEGAEITGPGGDGFVVEGTLVASAGQALVFACDADPASNGGFTPDYAYDVASLKLSNEGGTLGIRVDGSVVDEVAWDALPDLTGHAIALDPSSTDATANDAAASWCAAGTVYGDGDYGTPGAPNASCTGAPTDADGDGALDEEDCDPADPSIYPGADELPDGEDNDCDGFTDERAPVEGDLVITEIMDDPDPTDDDTGEWFEIQNVSADLLDLQGVEFSDGDGESFTIDAQVILDGDGLLLLGASSDADVNGGIAPDFVFDEADFHLGNDQDAVVISLGGDVLDEVGYDNDFPHEKGKSRSLDPLGMSPSRNDEAAYWCKGDGDYGTDGNQGTPGEFNDACG